MNKIDFAGLIEEVVVKFNQNRMGTKPTVFVTIPPEIPLILWHDDRLERLVRSFLYEALLMSNPETAFHIAVNTRIRLKDLEEFMGLEPLCWIQVRIAGYGLRMRERMIEDRLQEQSYSCGEWVGIEDSESQLAIFNSRETKLVFYLDTSSALQKCDLLVPVSESLLLPAVCSPWKKA